MKRALFYTLILSATLSTAPAFAQDTTQANQPAAATLEQVPFTGVSRAEVKAELARARRNGDLQPQIAENYPQLLPYQAVHAQQAANVRSLSRNDGPNAPVAQ
jgi:Domain of unknown function (DUF4148)